MARATSPTSAPVASQTAEIAFMLEILWARKALAASLESSEDQVFIVTIFSGEIQCRYTQESVAIAL